jgi:ERCC4-type nuclease
MVIITIDSREEKLYNELIQRDLEDYDITIVKELLNIGDIYIKAEFFEYIIERKTVLDLLASRNDGRLHEQKARLLSSNINNIGYIIEGDDIISSRNPNKLSDVTGIYLNTMFRDKIHIVFVKNIIETATFILILATRICKKPNRFIQNENMDYTDYLRFKTKKCKNIDSINCFIMMLGQIPGISNKLAKEIATKYHSMNNFLTNLKEDNSILTEIDGIGKKKAETIIRYLGIIV